MAWWRKLFGLGRSEGEPAAAGPDPAPARPAAIRPDDPRIALGREARLRHWKRLGLPDQELVTYLADPGPAASAGWPAARQAYHIVRRYDSLVLGTDGLSDPFVGKVSDESGYGIEVFVEIPHEQAMEAAFLRESWAFAVLEVVAQNIAGFGGILDRLGRDGVVHMAVPLLVPPAPGWTDDLGFTGVLIGLPARRAGAVVDLPLGPVRYLAVTLLRPDEALFAARGAENRDRLARLLDAAGHGHFSDPARGTVL
ncbi:MAG: hypothetical protein LCH69_13160 [Proteobacteria bacterium]|nr:hypothetical protein [Pseudomonadota bacterium]